MVYTGWLVTCLGFVSAATVWFERSVRVSDVTGYVVLDIAGCLGPALYPGAGLGALCVMVWARAEAAL